MKVQPKSSSYYVSKLCIESVVAGKVKKKSLTKCLKAVSNSVNNMKYGECNESIGYLKDILSSRGSKIMDKKLNLLDSILSCSVKINYDINAIQHCMTDMMFKRDFVWSKDFGVDSHQVSSHLTDDLAKKLKFNLLKRDFLEMEKKAISGSDRNLSLSTFSTKL